MKLKVFLSICILLLQNTLCSAGDFNAEKIYKKVSKSVVIIFTTDTYGRQKGQGSGVIISKDGRIVTNFHVIDDAEKIKVRINNVFTDAKLIGIDEPHDLAILKISCSNCTPVERSSNHKINIGEKIFAIGSPRGFENTISEGIISGRRHPTDSTEEILQISAPISPGSSGGAVVNGKGILIGISTAYRGDAQNVGFAVPDNFIEGVILKDSISRKELLIASYLRQSFSPELTGQPERMISLLNDVLRLDKHNEKALERLAYMYWATDNTHDALRICNQLLAYYPENFSGHFYNATINFRKENFRISKAGAKKLISMKSDFHKAHCLLGRSYYMLNDFDSSAMELQKAIALDSADTDAWYFLALAYSAKKNYTAALPCAIKAASYDTENYEWNMLAGLLCARVKDETRARNYFLKASKINSRSAVARLFLSDSYFKSRFYSDALREAKQMERLDNSICEAYEIMLSCYIKMPGNRADDKSKTFFKLRNCDEKSAKYYTAYPDSAGGKYGDLPDGELRWTTINLPDKYDSLINVISKKEKPLNDPRERKLNERKQQNGAPRFPARTGNSTYKETRPPADTVRMGGNNYIECNPLVMYQNKPIVTLYKWNKGEHADIDITIYNPRGAPEIKIVHGEIAERTNPGIYVYNTDSEFTCMKIGKVGSMQEILFEMKKSNPQGKGKILVNFELYMPDGKHLHFTPDMPDKQYPFYGGNNTTRSGGGLMLE
jgi:tetratricopeptide (TPR) repeat protein